MNFTREPIIETVITPKEGCKLVVRNSKGAGQEDYFVDAIEVVSFGSALFYRSIERPKSFLVPVTDYEVIELKETRLVLKNVGIEKSIKIGGGKETPNKESKSEDTEPTKKKEKKRSKKKKVSVEKAEKVEPKGEIKGGDKNDETHEVSSSIVRRLIPPPTQLIKEKLAKSATDELVEKDLPKKEEVKNEEKHSSIKQKDKSSPKEIKSAEVEMPAPDEIDKPQEDKKTSNEVLKEEDKS